RNLSSTSPIIQFSSIICFVICINSRFALLRFQITPKSSSLSESICQLGRDLEGILTAFTVRIESDRS
ncbi:hypothetical protein AKJ16_DCAP22219, partial [Drosera capensis]